MKLPKNILTKQNSAMSGQNSVWLDIMTEQCLMVIFGSVTLQDWAYAMNSLVFIFSLSIGHHALLLVYGSYIAAMSIIQPGHTFTQSLMFSTSLLIKNLFAANNNSRYYYNILSQKILRLMSHKTTWGNNTIYSCALMQYCQSCL